MSAAHQTSNVVVWFEIPARDFERAVQFYEMLLAAPLRRESINGERLGVFAYEPPGVGGAVMHRPEHVTAESGVIVYLNCNGRLDETMARVAPAGGRLAGPKVELPGGMGSFVHVFDTEGNRIGLHGR
jgi:predicted enzyme related to lactoylglutathione lyase